MSRLHNNKGVDSSSPNLDPQEIALFSSLAQDWWNLEGSMQTLHQLNPLRVQYIQQQLKPHPITNARCLDVGCGGGILSEALAKLHAQVSAIDASSDAIAIAQQHAQQSQLKIDYQVSTVEAYAANHNAPFSLITCMELLEHVPDPAQLIADCASLLAPEGKLVVSTLNRNLKSFLINIIGAEYITSTLPRGTHHYQKFIKPSELAAWGTNAGLHLSHCQGIRYLALQQTFELHDGPCSHYLMTLQAA